MKLATTTEKANGDFSDLLRNRELEARACESVKIQSIQPYSDEEIEYLSHQQPVRGTQYVQK